MQILINANEAVISLVERKGRIVTKFKRCAKFTTWVACNWKHIPVVELCSYLFPKVSFHNVSTLGRFSCFLWCTQSSTVCWSQIGHKNRSLSCLYDRTVPLDWFVILILNSQNFTFHKPGMGIPCNLQILMKAWTSVVDLSCLTLK